MHWVAMGVSLICHYPPLGGVDLVHSREVPLPHTSDEIWPLSFDPIRLSELLHTGSPDHGDE